jgi:transposase
MKKWMNLARAQLLGALWIGFRDQGGAAMKPLVSDALWAKVEPLLPPAPRRRFRFPGRKPLDCRKILTGILFVLKTGIAWDDLPADLGCGCGKTCRHYLRLWHRAGVWRKLHALLLAGSMVPIRSTGRVR